MNDWIVNAVLIIINCALVAALAYIAAKSRKSAGNK